jgi:PAS domain-containing protein
MEHSIDKNFRIKELIDNLPDVVISVDYPSGIIQYANVNAIERLGFSIKRAKTLRDLSYFVLPKHRRKYLQHWRDIKDGILVPSLVFEVKTIDGKII